MSRVLLPAVLLLTAVLSACGGVQSPPGTLDLEGQTSLAVGAPASLTAVLRGLSGDPIPATVTYTSSQPNVISVDGQGQLTVKRLTATSRPVELTASAAGRTATILVTTYGLELAVGTYVWNLQAAGAAPGRFVVVRYRPESEAEAVQASTYTVTAPGDERLTCPLSQNAVERACWWAEADATKYPSGEYRASLVQNGVTYTTTASLPDPEAALGLVGGASATLRGRDVTFAGELPAGAGWLYAYVAKRMLQTSALPGPRMRGQGTEPANDPQSVSVYATALPATLTVGDAVPAGAYEGWITAMPSNLSSFAEVLPEQFNVSATFGGPVTLR
ncbi:hypothetical protein HLB42_12905 [Deinococcus sp. D7000]|nr:hypothetical protein HLB42_12905 [Deinococcus sp. D7000]